MLVGYGIVSFGVLQIAEPIMHALHLPDVTLTYTVLVLALGFPVAVMLGWAFDINQGRIERTPASPTRKPRDLRLGFALIALGVLAAAPGIVWYFFVRGAAKPPAAISPATASPSVAVLPFVDMSATKDQEYFSDGIAEEILNALAAIEGLHVAGRTSSFSFKGKNVKLDEIARQLNVAYVLEGSIRKEGHRLRITAQLVNAKDGYHVWSQTFDRELAGIFALQDEISQAVVGALKVKLFPGPGSTRQEGRVADPEAYGEYLLGRQQFNRGLPESFLQAVDRFEKAVAIDGSYSPAWSGLAAALYAYADTGDTAPHEKENLELRALAAVDRAVAAGPGVADSYSVRGWLRLRISWDWAGAEADLKHALALAPGDATTYYRHGTLLAALGRIPEAIAVQRRAIELDPLDALAWANLGNLYSFVGQFDLARRALDRSLEIAPASLLATRELIFLDLGEGRPAEALSLSEKATVAWSRLSGTALAQHALGRPRESQDALEALILGFSHNAALQIAEVYAWRGERDRAFEWLERAYAQRDSGMARVKHRPGLQPIRGDPRFSALLKKMNLPLD